MTTLCPFATYRPVPSHSGPMTAHRGLVLHVQVGSNSCYGWFAVPANQASSTWWVGKDGTLEQYVDADMAAWAEAAGNFQWNSVETEGVPAEPLTDDQVITLARLYAWGHQTYGWSYQLTDDVTGTGFGWHGMGGAAWGGHTGCPGDLRKAQRAQILAVAEAVTTPVVSPASPMEDDPMIQTDQLVDAQLDTFHVDTGGRLVHHFFPAATKTWSAEVLATGCVPRGDLALNVKWAGDGMAHLFAEAPSGAQVHRYWDGKAWHADTQPAP